MKEIICPSCRRPLPPNSPQGLCPICALEGAKEASPVAGTPCIEDIQSSFPDFEIKECIGRGGMGIVYKAYQPAENREVALKILDPALSKQSDFAERFAREARTLEQLDHPNIVAIYEFGQNDDFYWFTMELVDGVNLRQAMQTAQFTPQQALDIIPGLCSALQYAHENGVFHRDVKPENILLDTDGNVKVADFGIARLIGEKAEFTLTRTGSTLGSTAYMAPEQIESPQDVDHRADIYSLGVVFYEMLTGSLPLGRFPAPSEKTGSHPGLDEVVFRALQKEREKRFQNANDFSRKVASPSTASSVFPLKGPLPWANIAIWAVIIGILSVFVGGVVNDTIAALGLITCLAGLLGCWWLLAEIRAGRHNKDDRPKLMRVSVKAPLCLLILCLIPIALWRAVSGSEAEKMRWEAEKRQRAATAAHLKAQMSYDHSTPATAMRSVIQAARNKDRQGFIIGIQGDIALAALQEDPGLASMMQEYAKLRFSKVSSAENGKAQVLVKSKKKRRLYNLIKEPDGWCVIGEYPTQALDEIALLERDVKAMITAAENKDFNTFKRYLSEEVLTLTKTDLGGQEEVLREFSKFSFVRIDSINTQVSPELGNVILSSNEREQRVTYQLVDGTWRIQLPDDYWSKRHLPREEITASASETPKPVGIDYSSPIAAFDSTLAVAKVKNEQLFAKSFADSYPSQLKELGLTPAQAIERFLRSPEAILKFRNRIDLRNPQDTKQATLILKLDEQTFEHQMVLETGQWRFVEPFFLKP